MSRFSDISHRVTSWVGSIYGVCVAIGFLAAWVVGGLFLGFSENYQLIGNDVMSAVAYVLLFIIQHSINRDAVAVHCKLDAIIHGLGDADNRMIGIESLSDEELDSLADRFQAIADVYRTRPRRM